MTMSATPGGPTETNQDVELVASHIQAILPPRTAIEGQYVHLRPLEPTNADALYTHLGGTEHASLWTFLPEGPYTDPASFAEFIARKSQSPDPLFFSVIDPMTAAPVGIVAILRIDLPNRCVELGWLLYSPAIQRSRLTTEVIYLMAKLVFETLHFRRCEWKCDDRNAPSKKAAARFGFTFEGLFRQHLIVKGRNRDTAWFSILDKEWGTLKNGFERWLDQSNFDASGRQVRRLEELR